MKLIDRYQYTKFDRANDENGERRYATPGGHNLASVTTILDATKPQEIRDSLAQWRNRMGQAKADEITTIAATRGTIMHGYLEKSLMGQDFKPGTNVYHKQAWLMAKTLLDSYIKPNLTEIWGLEATLYYPELYAGTTDCCGVYDGKPSIVDFKQSNSAKTDDRVHDYKLQLVAYANGHNAVYGTDIKQGVILMCTPDLMPQTWVVKDQEFEYFTSLWWKRVAQFYKV